MSGREELMRDGGAVMAEPNAIREVLIQMETRGTPTLFVQLDAEGRIRRSGEADGSHGGREMVVGNVGPELFERIRSRLPTRVLGEPSPARDEAASTGSKRALAMDVRLEDGTRRVRVFESDERIPGELRDFIAMLVEATDPWYRRQRNRKRAASPWWQFWSTWPT